MEYVYFFRCRDKVKIGRTKDVVGRFETIKTASPYEVENLGCIEVKDSNRLEQDIHYKFRDKRKSGEWFKITNEEVNETIDKFGRFELSELPETRQDYDGTYWERVRKEYESSEMTLKEFAKLKNIKLGTLKSRKSRERWNDSVVNAKKYKNSLSVEKKEVNKIEFSSDLIIESIAIIVDKEESKERKNAAKLILDYYIPEWNEIISV